ncbi:MAG: recombinase family protein [Brevundimonas mediterranea]
MEAIVYRRYSTDEQRDGSAQTLEAQLERCQDFAKARGWQITEILTDEGKSAYKGHHLLPDADLGKFVARLRQGEIARGTVLIADNLSRLSRRPVDEAMAWVHEVNGRGVEIALADTREVFKPNPSLGDFLQTAIKFGVSHQSSADKSDATRRSRNRLWKLAEAREGKWTTLAGLLPRWLERNKAKDGWITDDDMAETIRTIYRWSADGIGVNTIVNMLNARPDLPPFGQPKDYRNGIPAWTRSTVRQYLTSAIVEGDFRPAAAFEIASAKSPRFQPASASGRRRRWRSWRTSTRRAGRPACPTSVTSTPGVRRLPKCLSVKSGVWAGPAKRS